MKIKISFDFILIVLCLFGIGLSIYYLNIDNEIFDYKHEKKIDNLTIEKTNDEIKVPIVLYHNIDGKGLYSIPKSILKKQFDFIKTKKIKVISIDQLVNHILNNKGFDGKVMAITFDDGYNSMYTKLLPLVKKYKYPVTLFVYIKNIYKKSKKNITWNKLKILDKNKIDIQSHSYSHADLLKYCNNTLEDNYKLYKEIYLSKRILELGLNKNVEYFAFPYGKYNLKLIQLCRDAGYKFVFSTDYGSNVVTKLRFILKRHHIKNNYSLTKFGKIILKMQ